MKNSSIIPNQIKTGTFYSQILRIFRICTSLIIFENELHNIIEAFIQNEFQFCQLEGSLSKFVVNNFTHFKKFGILTKKSTLAWLLKIIKKYK